MSELPMDDEAEWEITHEDFDARWKAAEPADMVNPPPGGVGVFLQAHPGHVVVTANRARVDEGISAGDLRSAQIPA